MIVTRMPALVAMLLGAATLASAQQVTVTLADPAIAVEPGQHADIPFVFTNGGNVASGAVHFQLPGAYGSSYTFAQQPQDGCGPIGPSDFTSLWPALTVAPISAHSMRTCIVGVDRAGDTIDNALLGWYVSEGDDWISFEIGTFTDVGIGGTRIDAVHGNDGSTRVTYRLDARNGGIVDADDVLVSLGPTCVSWPIQVDMELPGGCIRDQNPCGFTGGPGAAARFSLAAGQSSSCLVRFTMPPDAADTEVAVSRFGGMTNRATGGYIGDGNPANDSLVLDLLGGAPAPAAAPALSTGSMLALGLTLAAIALGMQRRRRSRR